MRLWHKDLIHVLPNQQLLGQWRECCCIARNIKVNGNPHHALVNRIMDYPEEHFWNYTRLVYDEMINRGYECNFNRFWRWVTPTRSFWLIDEVPVDDIFSGWHNDRYYWQCCANLEEKYDCGLIPKEEWIRLSEEACLRL